jgi:biotin carboxylase
LLLLMAAETYRASDFLSAAGKLGLEVVVATPVRLALAAEQPERYLRLPFDDPAKAAEAARTYAAKRPLHGVVAVDDEAVEAGAAVAAALGLPGNALAAARRTRNKAAMRAALLEAGLPCPPFAVFATLDELRARLSALSYPCVVKPLSLSASRGVIRANAPAELEVAAARVFALLHDEDARRRTATGAGGVLVEAYLPGDELAVEALLDDGRLQVLALFDKPDPLEGPFFEETLYITPSRRSPEEQAAVRGCVAAATKALGLEGGPIHAEVRLHEGRATLVELAARTIGGLCGRTLRFGAGMSLEELLLRRAAGIPVLAAERERRAAGVMMLPIPRAGVLASVDGVERAREVPGIVEVSLTAVLGKKVVPLPEGRHYLGFLFARAEAPAEVEQALREAQSRLRFHIEPG